MAMACGKVGDPKPPINRTPLAVNGLNAGQSGHTVTLSWINPARYVGDKEAITDLGTIRILRNGVQIAQEKAGAPGQPQSYSIDVSKELDAEMTFAVQIETSRGRSSTVSTPVTIRPRDVPGPPVGLQATVDQERITLRWMVPQLNPTLAELYFVQRSDRPAPVRVMATSYEDEDYEVGKKYDYTVTAARGGDTPVSGLTGASLSVVATDEVPPLAPTGLTVMPAGLGAVFLRWDRNKERDVATYLVYRSDQEKPIVPPRAVEAFSDPEYRPGFTYQVVAVDKSGNESAKSAPAAGP